MPEERKLVTILFADVTGSTALGDTLDPEDVRALMSRYYTHARQIVIEHGGTLEKFIGDAIMAVFGLTQAHSDDAERGLAAALALHAAIASDSILASTFQLRIGVNTGEVVATSEADRDDFLITGDAVNVAARLQQHAAPGETLVGERTMHASHPAFLFDEQRTVEVKGKRLPLHVFPLKGPRTTRQVTRPALVGRDTDLLQLKILQARVLQEHIPQLISIVAPAGTGKSRLIEEFLNHLDPADGFQVATVRNLPYGQTLTYWPLRTLLTSFQGEEITRTRIIDIFRQAGHDPEKSVRLADSVLTGLGIQKEARVDREDIFDGWRLLIEIMARKAPRIIFFEDLHWASDSLLDLVEYILTVRIQAPILFITLSRPELLDRCPHWGGGRQNFTSLALQSLTPLQTRTLIKHLMNHTSEETYTALVERSGGNPFFVIELVHSLYERPEIDTPVTSNMLPDTVHATVQARLDQLSATERAVVQAASIPLRRFQKGMLSALMEETSGEEIDRALDGLQARDFIVSEGWGTDTYTFRHMLISTVAYGTLARAERIRLHSKLAAWLGKTTGESNESVEALAYHSYEAVKLSRQSALPLALPIEPAKAIHYLRRAGELAAHIGNFTEARTYLQTAIDIAPHHDLLTLYEALGDSGVFWSLATIEAYHKALTQWNSDPSHDPLTGARLMRKLLICYTRGGLCLRNQHLQEEVADLSKQAHRLAEAAGNEYEQWRLHVADLFALRFTGQEDADTRRKVGLEAAEYFQRQGDWIAFSEALDSYASISGTIGANTDMLEASQRRLTVSDLPATERKDALFMIVKGYIALNDFENCIKVVEEALAQEQSLSLGEILSSAMYAAYLCGRWAKAREFAPRLALIWERAQHDDLCEALDGYLALFHIARAQEDEAAKDAATTILKQISPDKTHPERLFLEALFEDDPKLLDTPSDDLHSICLWERLLLYNEHGIPSPHPSPPEKDAHLLHGNSPHWVLEINRALACGDTIRLEQAIDEVAASRRIVHAARMRIVLAQRSGDLTHLERARPVFEQLGDRRSLRKLEEVRMVLASG